MPRSTGGWSNENAHLRQELKERYDFAGIVGNSGPMQRVYEQVAQVARTNTTVLLRGESGTGKELIAQRDSLQLAAREEAVRQGQLRRAARHADRVGAVRLRERGRSPAPTRGRRDGSSWPKGARCFSTRSVTCSSSTQVKLLRVLQEREFERLGGHETLKADVRLIAATNKDLERAIEQGKFREDLFYRLNVFPIFIPPLRERKPDVLLLADHFLQRFSAEHGRDIRRLATPAIDMLTSYHWPGNARELQNVIERAVLVCDGHVIHAHHLSPTLQTAEASGTVMSIALDDAVAAYEKDLLQDALKSARGNRAKAARLLRTTERIVNYKVRKLGIDWKRFKG